MRKDFKTGGRVGLKQGGPYLPLRGVSGPKGVAKAFRGKAGFKESQALQKKLKPHITETRTIGTTKAPVTYTKPAWESWKKTKSQQAQRKQAHAEAGRSRLQAKYPDFKFKSKGGKV